MDSIVLLFLISSLVSLGAKLFQKLCSDTVVGDSKSAYVLFLAVNGLFACGFFWLFGGLRIHLNLTTLIYSLVYAAVLTMLLIANLLVYQYATIAAVNIIPTGFSLLGSMLIGYAFFGEEIGWRTVVRIAIMIVASVLIFFDRKPLHPEQDKLEPKKKLFPMIAVFAAVILFGYGNTIVTKSFAISPNVTDANSFFFMTNAVMVLGALAVLAVGFVKERKSVQSALILLKPKKLISLAGNTLCSNVGSLISLRIVALMDVSIATPISSAVGIFLAIVSSWIFRERLGLYSYLAAAISVVAVIL